MTTTFEREIKLRFDRLRLAREAVLATGATPLLGRGCRRTRCSTRDDEALRRRRCVLRVRVENGKSRLTFKGPVQPGDHEDPRGARDRGRRRRRSCCGSSSELGLHVWFRYEKYREEFAHEDVIVAIDETPVGVFVEIEGSEAGHRRDGRGARAIARPTTCSIRTAACSSSTARRRADRHRHGVRRHG